jgi:1-acyl-sn-glycerol-3-phosphate acyltransferase
MGRAYAIISFRLESFAPTGRQCYQQSDLVAHMANALRVTLKLIGALPLLISYLIVSSAITMFVHPGQRKRLYLLRNTSFFSRPALKLLGVRIHSKHLERLHKDVGSLLVVSNHLSYVDILAISSLMPAVFITSVELKNTFLLGTLSKFGGSVFIERRRASGLKKEIETITHVLGHGFTVALFPEGTTSNGEYVQPFKNSLFESAIKAECNILPLCLRYTKVNSRHITIDSRDSIFYYGGVTLCGHLPRLLALQSVDLEVHPLETIRVHTHDSRKELAARACNAINAAYHE